MTAQDMFKPIKGTSVVQDVVSQLTDAMIRKELCPGDKIPTEIELAEALGVGRNSVREAIKILISFGVLEIRRPEGTFVTDHFTNKMLDPLLYGIILDASDNLEDLKELREWLDTGMLILAAGHANKDGVARLEQAFADLKQALLAGDGRAAFEADNNFHDVMAELAGNPLFSKIAHVVRLLTYELRQRTIHNMTKTVKGQQDMVRVHEEIYLAIRNHDTVPANQIIQKSYFYDQGALDTE